jgi:transcriptional regulator with XRE-family HTH domain
MNIVRQLRNHAGLTQHALAVRAGTSQPTIAAYEAGAKSPTLSTLQKMASALGVEMIVTLTPEMTREDRRSLAYHRAVADKLRENPVATLNRAKRILMKMSQQSTGPKRLFERWKSWLDLPIEELISKMLDPGMGSRDMRQVSPFAGLLSPAERVRILKGFRKEHDT